MFRGAERSNGSRFVSEGENKACVLIVVVGKEGVEERRMWDSACACLDQLEWVNSEMKVGHVMNGFNKVTILRGTKEGRRKKEIRPLTFDLAYQSSNTWGIGMSSLV